MGRRAGGTDTHSYCSGHMLMRVTGLEENRGGREGGKGGGDIEGQILSRVKTQQAQEEG